jgi:hypothetical protein
MAALKILAAPPSGTENVLDIAVQERRRFKVVDNR